MIGLINGFFEIPIKEEKDIKSVEYCMVAAPSTSWCKAAAGANKLQLYSFWLSSCSCRVQIALNLKGLDFNYKAVDLVNGEQFSPEFLKLNPMGWHNYGLGTHNEQYLEEKYPQHPLLPKDLKLKAINFQAANIVSAHVQPLQNPAILVSMKLSFS
nr:glutathione S-transferase zeta class-like [Ipomoea batatas]